MELDAAYIIAAVPQCHDLPLFGIFGSDGEAVGEMIPRDDPGMVTSGAEAGVKAVEQGLFPVGDPDVGAYAVVYVTEILERGAEGFTDRLFTQADTEDTFGRRILPDKRQQDPGFLGNTGAGGKEDLIETSHLGKGDPVVAVHFHLCIQLFEDMQEVVGEGIVIV